MKRLIIILSALVIALGVQAQSKIGRGTPQDAYVATAVTADAAATVGGVAKYFIDVTQENLNLSITYGVKENSGTTDGKIYVQVSNEGTIWATLSTISLSDVTSQSGNVELTTFPYKYLRLYYDEVSAADIDIRADIIAFAKK